MPSQNLTQQFVNKAPCPSGKKAKVDYFDTKISGLFLKVLKSGRKTYYLRFKHDRDGKREKKLGDASILTLDEARTNARKKLAQLQMGNDPFAERDALKQVPKFADFVHNQYMPHAKEHKRSWNVDEWILRLHVLPVLGHLHLDEITKQHAIELVRKHRQHPEQFKPSSTNRMISVCRRVFSLALKWDVPGMQKNPMDAVQVLAENNQRERYLTNEELPRLMKVFDNHEIKMVRHIIWMLILTGARKREVLDAKWQDFDLERCQWRVPYSKSGKARYVPLSEGAIRQLSKVPRIEGCDYVFPNEKTKRPYVNIFSSWDTIRKEAGIPDVRIHDLRHNYASYLVNLGYSIYDVQNILGHSNIKTTQRYAHLSQGRLLKASNALSTLIEQSLSIKFEPTDHDIGTLIEHRA
ncbi:tyrosine-type recombinase/integrase [Halomonas sp. McH1-25]|uniref:tyrosine-type recombinase/integrase n=1 Tax=unclassified Halomonas TaxID=2609666 RepID=UPI001EF590A3|nr:MULTISPECIES: site-specific integrase [unclassified Halomonas]MCG7598633.1 tyrosine-type recombinase/integrase [Halomonas sp. McH1-25]MCP1343616.1 tyrosine-type recombinase/integrase [Halomonas sp. FL8]MCP1363303.1 tyrosine-type recombinase/integrase [Halomonas sp. BBD45]MCP1364014.1 tyrosine-type recombinase/integrase [Halomonas sp. BBD48]